MTKIKKKGTIKMAQGSTKFQLDRAWLTAGIPLAMWLFTAGMGWNQLSYAQESIKDLKNEIKEVRTDRSDAKDRLIVVETKLSELLRAVEKLGVQLDATSKRPGNN